MKLSPSNEHFNINDIFSGITAFAFLPEFNFCKKIWTVTQKIFGLFIARLPWWTWWMSYCNWRGNSRTFLSRSCWLSCVISIGRSRIDKRRRRKYVRPRHNWRTAATGRWSTKLTRHWTDHQVTTEQQHATFYSIEMARP